MITARPRVSVARGTGVLVHFAGERPTKRRRLLLQSPARTPIIGKLTTHVLDTAHGCPAAGIAVTLQRLDPDHDETIATVTLDADGRSPSALLDGERCVPGRYRLTFEVAAYFRAKGATLAEPPFLDRVPIEFAIADAAMHYHVPLLVSPWSYSTYRGS